MVPQVSGESAQLADVILRSAADVVILDPVALHPTRIQVFRIGFSLGPKDHRTALHCPIVLQRALRPIALGVQ